MFHVLFFVLPTPINNIQNTRYLPTKPKNFSRQTHTHFYQQQLRHNFVQGRTRIIKLLSSRLQKGSKVLYKPYCFFPTCMSVGQWADFI